MPYTSRLFSGGIKFYYLVFLQFTFLITVCIIHRSDTSIVGLHVGRISARATGSYRCIHRNTTCVKCLMFYNILSQISRKYKSTF